MKQKDLISYLLWWWGWGLPLGLMQFTSKEATVKATPTPTTPVHP